MKTAAVVVVTLLLSIPVGLVAVKLVNMKPAGRKFLNVAAA